jgi:hypothetical protein
LLVKSGLEFASVIDGIRVTWRDGEEEVVVTADVEEGGRAPPPPPRVDKHLDFEEPLGKRWLEKCENIFKSLDPNRSEVVDSTELFAGLLRDGRKTTMQQAKAMIKMAKEVHNRNERQLLQDKAEANAAAAAGANADKAQAPKSVDKEPGAGAVTPSMTAANKSSTTDVDVMTRVEFLSIMRERAIGLHDRRPSQSLSDW